MNNSKSILGSIIGLMERIPHGILEPSVSERSFLHRYFENLADGIVQYAFLISLEYRRQLLQSFNQWDDQRLDQGLPPEVMAWYEAPEAFAPNLLKRHCPAWYQELIDEFSNEESQIFLKLLPVSHELIGTIQGIEIFVKVFLQHAASAQLTVRLHRSHPYYRRVRQFRYSRLGTNQYSRPGSSMVLGKKVIDGLSYMKMEVGPVSYETAEWLRRSGWIAGRTAGPKLHRLFDIILPFYRKAVVVLILAEPHKQGGGRLGSMRIGQDLLGNVHLKNRR